MSEGSRLIEIRRRPEARSAVVFLHGFTGDADLTWDRFPLLLQVDPALAKWDILNAGYSTGLMPDLRGIWTGDPDLPILAKHLSTRMSLPPLKQYRRVALVGHSMGGLVIQRAVLDDQALRKRVSHVILFGTPSAGLWKASLVAKLYGIFKRQVVHMAAGGSFIRQLRSEWVRMVGDDPPFVFAAVAGDRDQFVPPESSLNCFAAPLRQVVTGDHLSLVRPRDAQAESFILLREMLLKGEGPDSTTDALRVASEAGEARAAIRAADQRQALTELDVVNVALALDRQDQRKQAIAFLQAHQSLGTRVQATLAGRIKRMWLQSGAAKDLSWALELYEAALQHELERDGRPEQVAYLAINAAFLRQVGMSDVRGARRMARLALQHGQAARPARRRLALQAEARLYLGQTQAALELYRELKTQPAKRWELVSTGQQALQVAAKLGDAALQEEIRTIFEIQPEPRNRIFFGYHRKDRSGLRELQTMLKPVTRAGQLEWWDDRKLKANPDWRAALEAALQDCRVVVFVASDSALGSDFMRLKLLPALIARARERGLEFVWLLWSPCLWEESELKQIEPLHDVSQPLAALGKVKRKAALKEIGKRIKVAVFS